MYLVDADLSRINKEALLNSFEKIINIPSDSSFKISNNGFVGSPYVEISLGTSPIFYKNNEETENNIDAISLEEIINNFIFK